MFERDTVIILGAGASAQFGFPLSIDIFKSLEPLMAATRKGYDDHPSYFKFPCGVNNFDFFYRKPIQALICYLNHNPVTHNYLTEDLTGKKSINSLLRFYSDFKSSTQDTIDLFLSENPQHQKIGKLIISLLIMMKMYESHSDFGRLKSFSERDYKDRRNWYHKLINHIRHGAIDGPSIAENKLTIITFNYDLSLEQALKDRLSKTEIHQDGNYKDVVKILHVNGYSQNLPKNLTNAGDFVVQCAKNFHLVGEKVESSLQDIRHQATRAMENAERIYVLGFNFDRSNISAISLDRVHKRGTDYDRSHIYCHNFDGNLGLNQKIKGIKIPDTNILSGTKKDALHIDQVIDDGFFEL